MYHTCFLFSTKSIFNQLEKVKILTWYDSINWDFQSGFEVNKSKTTMSLHKNGCIENQYSHFYMRTFNNRMHYNSEFYCKNISLKTSPTLSIKRITAEERLLYSEIIRCIDNAIAINVACFKKRT